MGNIVDNNVISLYDDRWQLDLFWWPGSNIVSLVNYTSEDKQTNDIIEKEIRFVVSKGGEWGKWELDEGGQRYKHPVTRYINTRDVMSNMINIMKTAVCYIWKLLRE